MKRLTLTAAALALLLALSAQPVLAAKVTLDLGNAEGIKLVGAFQRWDSDGNANKLVDKDQKIDQPQVQFTAEDSGHGKWVFADLPPASYDLVIMRDKVRIEGFSYPPVMEFDAFIPPTAKAVEEAQAYITEDIKKSPQYENKMSCLYAGGDKKVTRALVQLLRDKPTSYTPGAGTLRHEVWQYDWHYGGWMKNKRTKVLDRIIIQISELKQWTWVWEPKLGMVEVKKKPLTIKYTVPAKPDPEKLKGLYPY